MQAAIFNRQVESLIEIILLFRTIYDRKDVRNSSVYTTYYIVQVLSCTLKLIRVRMRANMDVRSRPDQLLEKLFITLIIIV